jgi:hypothetical protein
VSTTPLANELVALCRSKGDDGEPRFSPADIVEALPFLFMLGCPNEGSFPVPPELRQLMDPPAEEATREVFGAAVRGHYEKHPPRSPLIHEMAKVLRARLAEGGEAGAALSVLGVEQTSSPAPTTETPDVARRFSLKVPGES